MPRANTNSAPDRWRENAARPRRAKQVTLNAPFGGLPAGTVLFIGTPAIIQEYIEGIPRGETRTLQRLRRDIARTHRCQAMCPVSTAIFLRIVAEVAWQDMEAGAAEVTPVWRVIEPGTPIARRLGVPADWLRERRALEASA